MRSTRLAPTWLFSLYIFLLLSLSCLSQTPEAALQPEAASSEESSNQHVVPPYKEQLSLNKDQTIFYRIDLSKFSTGQDLSVSLISFSDMAPKAYLSKDRENPTNFEANDLTHSEALTGGVLFVSDTQIAGAKTVFLGLKCELESCQADLSIDPTNEFTITADGQFHDELQDALGGASTAVVRLRVPADDSTERIVINAEAIPTKNEFEPFVQMFLNKGKEIPYSQSSQRTPKDSWDEGKTLSLYKGSQTFCTDCEYTLSLKFHEYSAIRLQASVFSERTELWKQSFTDAVRANHRNIYTISSGDALKNGDVVVSVNPHEGLPEVYFNCDELPEDLNDFLSKHELKKAEDIVISSDDVKSCKTDKLYLVIYGSQSSSYSIKADVKGTERLQFNEDHPVTGDISPDQSASEEFVVPLETVEKITIELETTSDVDVKLINCRFASDCPGLSVTAQGSQEIRHPDMLNANNFKYRVEKTSKGKQITVDIHNGGCYPILALEKVGFMHPVCAYRVVLTNKDKQKAQYTLSVDLEGHQELLPGMPKMDTIFESERKFYRLSVPQTDAAEVSFQVTVISGDVVMYVSRTEEFPAEGSEEAKYAFEGRIVFRDEDLKGFYYIAIQSYKSSSYVLSGTVKSSDGKIADYAIELQEGVPQKGVLLLKHENPALYYKMYADLPDDWEGMIRIVATPLRGTVMMAVNNEEDKLPDADKGKWDSNSNYIKIHSSDPDFVRKGVYHIGVFVDWSDPKAFSLEDITFNIAYALSKQGKNQDPTKRDDKSQNVAETAEDSKHMVLTDQFPYHGKIRAGETQYFKVFAHPNDTSLTVYKEDNAQSIDLFASITAKNKFPGLSSYDYSTKDSNRNFIRLNKRDIEKACENFQHTVSVRFGCEIYFAVSESSAVAAETKSSDATELQYTVRLSKDSHAQNSTRKAVLPLENALEYNLQIPESDEPALFYFYPYPGKDIHITVSADDNTPEIYVNVQKYTVHATKSSQIDHLSRVPNRDKFDHSSKIDQNSEDDFGYIMIPGEEQPISNIVTVAVYFNPINSKKTPSNSSSHNFRIVVSSETIRLNPGKAYPGLVHEKEYTYYEINIGHDDCTLLIALTSLNGGHADIVISADKEFLPTLAINDFASISSQRTELIEIGLDDIYPQKSMRGKWIIGVYGKVKTSYTLTVAYEENKMMTVVSGTPMELYIKEKDDIFLRYQHDSQRDFKIRLDKQSGDVMVYINTLTKGMTLAEHLPNATSYIWRIEPESDSRLTISRDDPNFCVDCTYVFKIEAIQASKLAFSISEHGSMLRIQNSLQYSNTLPPKGAEWFFFASTDAADMSLNVDVTSGSANVYVSHSPTVSAQNFIWGERLTPAHPAKVIQMEPSKQKSRSKSGDSFALDKNGNVESQPETYYIYIENSGKDEAEVNFIIEGRNSSTVLVLDKSYHATFDVDQTKSLLYYSPHKDETLILTTLYCFESPIKRSRKVQEKSQAQEQPQTQVASSNFDNPNLLALEVKVKFWEEGVTAGVGTGVKVTSDFTIDNLQHSLGATSQKVCVLQTDRITGYDKAGRYEIEMRNPYLHKLTGSIYIHTSETKIVLLNQREVYSGLLKANEKSIFDLSSAKKQSFYFDLLVCSGSLKFNYANSLEDLQSAPKITKELKAGQDILINSYSNELETKYASLESTSADNEMKYVLRSNHISEYQAIQYDQIGSAPEIEANHVFQDEKSTLHVKYQPVVYKATTGSEQVLYNVKVCPKRTFSEYEAYCGSGEGCSVVTTKATTDSRDPIEAQIESVPTGRYMIVVTAMITHHEQNVYSLVYPVREFDVYIPKSGEIKRVVLSILGLMSGLGLIYLAYKRRFKKQAIIAKIINTEKKGYGFFGDEDLEAESAKKLPKDSSRRGLPDVDEEAGVRVKNKGSANELLDAIEKLDRSQDLQVETSPEKPRHHDLVAEIDDDIEVSDLKSKPEIKPEPIEERDHEQAAATERELEKEAIKDLEDELKETEKDSKSLLKLQRSDE